MSMSVEYLINNEKVAGAVSSNLEVFCLVFV